MLDGINRFFQRRLEPESAGSAPDPRRLQVATCALLLEVAQADDNFSAEERELIVGLLRERFELSAEDADELIDLTRRRREASPDLYQFARLINGTYDRSEKLQVLEQLWSVVYSDGRLEMHEDALMHKLALLLQLRQDELIALKLRVKRALEQPDEDSQQ
jgi:uncharacterized tellurite resistance protein B-like protein